MNLYRLISRRNDLKALVKGRLQQRIVRKTIFRHASKAAAFVSRVLRAAR